MPEPKSPRGKSTAPTTPDEYLTTPSQQLPGADYHYTVELVSRIEFQLGKLTQATEGLTDQIKSHGGKLEKQAEKLEQVCRDVHVAKVILWIMGGLMAATTTFIGIAFKAFLDHAWPVAK